MTLEIHLELLRKAADSLEQRYLSPIYLVGSFQRQYKNASDIDIVMVVTDERLIRLCGFREYCDKRFQFNRKQKLWIEKYVTDFDIDFKIETVKEFDGYNKENQMKLGKYVWMAE